MKLVLAGLAALAVLASPAADAARKPDQGQADFRLDPASGMGLLVVSMTMPKFSHGHLSNLAWSLHFRPTTAGAKRSFRRSITLERESNVTGRTIRSDLGKEVFGVVFAVDLPAGEYVLTHWYLDGNTTSLNIRTKNARELPFSIRAGRATYVGSLEMKVDSGKNLFNQEVMSDAGILFSDQHERDVAVLFRKFPLITADQIDVEVTIDPSWQSLSQESEAPVERIRDLDAPVPTPPIN